MSVAFEVTDIIPAAPEAIYTAWLDSAGHAAMTGAPAQASAIPGEPFSAWDGYISGTNLELEPGKRILQARRTTAFPSGAPDSRLEILLAAHIGGTQVTIRHSALPEDGMQYYQGWIDFYFNPMKAYFGGN